MSPVTNILHDLRVIDSGKRDGDKVGGKNNRRSPKRRKDRSQRHLLQERDKGILKFSLSIIILVIRFENHLCVREIRETTMSCSTFAIASIDLSFLNDFSTHDYLNRLATPDEAESLLFFLAINQSFREKIARLIYILD